MNRIDLDVVDSTNTFAIKWAANNEPVHGTVITAQFQSQGRGQIGRFWYSSPTTNLLFTLIVKPKEFLASEQFELNRFVCCGLLEAFTSLYPEGDFRIKWPNDLYEGNRKIGGILIQNVLKGKYLQTAFIGIGLNINEEHFPAEIPNPCSLKQLTGRYWSLDEVLNVCLKYLNYNYGILFKHKNLLTAKYLENLYLKGVWRTYYLEDGSAILGKILDVSNDGKLRMEMEDQRTKTFSFREITFHKTLHHDEEY